MDGKQIYSFVKEDICWTNTPYNPTVLGGLPSIEMIGYEQQWSTAITNINVWLKRMEVGENPYSGLYAGKYTRTYVLPFFTEYHHNITQNWDANTGPLGDLVKSGLEMIETAAKAILPAAGIVYPKSYAGSTPGTYSFTFYLINTNAGNGADLQANIIKNKDFLETFVKDNLHDQNNALSVVPPLIYEILIPGVRWSPAAVVSSLTVNNKGSLNNYILAGMNYIIPDAWEVTVTITELFNESKKLWEDAVTGGSGIKGLSTRVILQGSPIKEAKKSLSVIKENVRKKFGLDK
jgi:hypothetical protein